MQQSIPKSDLGIKIQECGNDGEFQLTLDGLKRVHLRLNAQQARSLACALMYSVNRAEAVQRLPRK